MTLLITRHRGTGRVSVSLWLVLAAYMCSLAPAFVSAQSPAPALTGTISSPSEPKMEGVVVSAKHVGSTIAVSVISDAEGRYSFPPDRLEPGEYDLRVRAVGYDLASPTNTTVHTDTRFAKFRNEPWMDSTVRTTVTAGKTTKADIRLQKTRDLAAQLTNGEWFMSWPENTDIKNGLLNCTQCHSLQPVVRSTLTAEQWVPVLQRMGRYSQGTTPMRPQMRPGNTTGGAILAQSMDGREGAAPVGPALLKQTAEYLASVNLSGGRSTWSYPLKTYPRPSGKSTRVIVTEYDLPRRETLPHDAVADPDGTIWYGDFGSHVLGNLDPKTGKVTEYQLPVTKPGAPLGSLDVVLDKQGNVWLGTMYQGSLAKFDRKTKQFQTWGSPRFRERDEARIAMVMPINNDEDGQVWIGGDDEYQVDVKTGEWKTVDYSVGLKDKKILKELSSYGVASDSKNNFYGMNLNGTYIIRIDGKTKDVTPFATPTPNAGPRRGHMDDQDRLFFAEFRANKIGMFDTKTQKFQEWAVPTPWTNVYDAIADKAGFAWAGGMNNDRIVRVNTKTGETFEYLLPRWTNVRRVNVGNSTPRPTFWIGNNLEATLIKVEPVE
jgi:virginiamycin B lyase